MIDPKDIDIEFERNAKQYFNNMEEKTIQQKQIDKDCGCVCHTEEATTQNFMWCGYCHKKHLKDSRYPKVYSKLHLIPAIHKFIDQMIDIAVEEREKEIVEMIKASKRQTKGLAQYGMGYDDALDDCFNLIKKKLTK